LERKKKGAPPPPKRKTLCLNSDSESLRPVKPKSILKQESPAGHASKLLNENYLHGKPIKKVS